MNNLKVFKVSVIIVAYKRDLELENLLGAIYDQSIPIEQIEISVVDNEGLCIKAKERYSKKVTSWISTKQNIGASAGRNLAVKAATSPYLIFLDDDGIPDKDFIQVMLTAFEENPNLIAARGKIIALNHPLFTSAAAHYDCGSKRCNSTLDIEGATCIRKDAYELVKGYDENIFGNEGIELGSRLKSSIPNGKILYIPEAIFKHDLFKGIIHMLSKAKRMAYSESAIHPSALKLKNTQENKIPPLPDGRSKFQKSIGKLVIKVYKVAVLYYRKNIFQT